MQEKFKGRRWLLFLTVLLALLAMMIVLMVGLKQSSNTVFGTYSAGNEPSMDNLYLVLKDDRFAIYNPEKLLEEGTFKKLEGNGMNIYKLSSGTGTWNGYIVYHQKEIVLLNFMDTEVYFKKVSEDAVYTYSK